MYRTSYYKTNNAFIQHCATMGQKPDQEPPFIPPPTTKLNINENFSAEDYSEAKENGENKVCLKWNKQKHANTADPAVWGSAFWFVLHNGAAHYPVKASPMWAQHMKNFILAMPVMIPCEKCADHALAHIKANEHRLDEVVSGRDNLFKFFYDFHNYVNRRYGKPIPTLEEAWSIHSGSAEVHKLDYSTNCDHE